MNDTLRRLQRQSAKSPEDAGLHLRIANALNKVNPLKAEREWGLGIELHLADTYREVKNSILEAASVLDPFPTTEFYAKRVKLWRRWRTKEVKSLEEYPIVQLPGLEIELEHKSQTMIQYMDPKTADYDYYQDGYSKRFVLHSDGIYAYDIVTVILEGFKGDPKFLPSIPTKIEFLEAYPIFWPYALRAIYDVAEQRRKSKRAK